MNVVSVDTSLLTYTVVTECLDRGDGRRWVDDDDGAITGKSEREIKQGDWVWWCCRHFGDTDRPNSIIRSTTIREASVNYNG